MDDVKSNIVVEDKSVSPKKRKHIDILRDQAKQKKEQVIKKHIDTKYDNIIMNRQLTISLGADSDDEIVSRVYNFLISK